MLDVGLHEVGCSVVGTSGGESDSANCTFQLSVEQDCYGSWQAWGACSLCPDATQTRTYKASTLPTADGEPCPDDELRPCPISCAQVYATLNISQVDAEL